MTIDDVPVGLPFTISTLRVERSLGTADHAAAVVAVWQEGAEGLPKDTSTSFELLRTGERYLLFLAPALTPGIFSLCGGPQGVYRVIDDTVLPLAGNRPDPPVNLSVSTVDEAVSRVVAALNRTPCSRRV